MTLVLLDIIKCIITFKTILLNKADQTLISAKLGH
jgi:hypothetical protein